MAYKVHLQSHEPSDRRDSGMTRSRVRGSTAIPATDLSGTMDGLDMVEVDGKESSRACAKVKAVEEGYES